MIWHKVLNNKAHLLEGRVMTVTAGNKDFCLTHYQGKYTALDNKCPHQGGPMGEGSIENGLLRCPWHGWDFCPHGGSVGDFDDGLKAYPLKIEGEAIFIGLEPAIQHQTTISDIMVETLINWGVTSYFGMVGHSNLGLADAIRIQEKKGRLTYIGIRHEGAAAFAASAYGKLTGKTRRMYSYRWTWQYQYVHWFVGCESRSCPYFGFNRTSCHPSCGHRKFSRGGFSKCFSNRSRI